MTKLPDVTAQALDLTPHVLDVGANEIDVCHVRTCRTKHEQNASRQV